MTTLTTTNTNTTTAAFAPIGFDASILAGQVGQSSIKMYARDFAEYHNTEGTGWADLAGFNPLAPATFARFRAYLASETTLTRKPPFKPYSPNTVNRMLTSVRSVMTAAAEQGFIDRETADGFRDLKGVKTAALRDRMKPGNGRHRIEPSDMRCILDKPDTSTLVGKRDAALLATLQSSGLRVSELVGLTVGNLTTTKGKRGQVAHLIVNVMGKGQSEPRDAYISVEAYAKIMAWLDARPVMSQHIFTAMNDGLHGNVTAPTTEPMTTVGAWKLVQRYAKRCGLSHISTHDFRRFVGTQLAADDIRKAQKALGHADINTTARHYVLDSLEPGLTDDLC